MKRTVLFCIFLCALYLGNSENIGIDTLTPNSSAILDVNSQSKGFLPPRMTSYERDQITSPAQGLVIFNTSISCLEILFRSPMV